MSPVRRLFSSVFGDIPLQIGYQKKGNLYLILKGVLEGVGVCIEDLQSEAKLRTHRAGMRTASKEADFNLSSRVVGRRPGSSDEHQGRGQGGRKSGGVRRGGSGAMGFARGVGGSTGCPDCMVRKKEERRANKW